MMIAHVSVLVMTLPLFMVYLNGLMGPAVFEKPAVNLSVYLLTKLKPNSRGASLPDQYMDTKIP